MIPPFTEGGLLPPGVHPASWSDVVRTLGQGKARRRLLQRLLPGARAFRRAGAGGLYLAGSFVTASPHPSDIDVLWDPSSTEIPALPRVLREGAPRERRRQKQRFGAEFIRVDTARDGPSFLEFFQTDKRTDEPKGIILLGLDTLPSSPSFGGRTWAGDAT